MTIPTTVTSTGLVPLPPSDIHDRLISDVSAARPDYTANLPGILIEDVSSTDVAAIALCDSARVEIVNSIVPATANDYLLGRLGAQAGIPYLPAAYSSVGVVFLGVPGYVIPVGFQVSDGTNLFTVEDGGIIGSNGQSDSLFCQATMPGETSAAPNTVTTISTTLPAGVTLTCTNPLAGNPGDLTAETPADYRIRVLQAQRASGVGAPSYLRTLLSAVDGVEPRLVSIQTVDGGGWKMLVGGTADPYDVAYAILKGLGDISQLKGSTIPIGGITFGPNAVVSTIYNHGLSIGMTAYVYGITVGMIGINGVPLPIVNVIDELNFQTSADTTNFGAYISGGYLMPNARTQTPIIIDYPDQYAIPFVAPPLESVAIVATWNTPSTTKVNDASVAALAAPAIAGYVNSVYVGQPLNLDSLHETFRTAVSSILTPELVTRLVFTISINGTSATAGSGTRVVLGDPESYLFTPSDGSLIDVTRG